MKKCIDMRKIESAINDAVDVMHGSFESFLQEIRAAGAAKSAWLFKILALICLCIIGTAPFSFGILVYLTVIGLAGLVGAAIIPLKLLTAVVLVFFLFKIQTVMFLAAFMFAVLVVLA